MKYVRCIVSTWERDYGICHGKIYPVEKEGMVSMPTYFLMTRAGSIQFYQSEFEVVGCKCGIKNCLTHRLGKA